MLQGWPAVGKGISGTSKQVSTFTTPGIFSAQEVSIFFTKPWAMVECFMRTYSASPGIRSS